MYGQLSGALLPWEEFQNLTCSSLLPWGIIKQYKLQVVDKSDAVFFVFIVCLANASSYTSHENVMRLEYQYQVLYKQVWVSRSHKVTLDHIPPLY